MKTLAAILMIGFTTAALAEDLPVLKWQNGGEFDTIVSDGQHLAGFLTVGPGQTFIWEIDCKSHLSQLTTLTGEKDVVRPIDVSRPNRGKDVIDQFCGRRIENQMPKYAQNAFKLPEYHMDNDPFKNVDNIAQARELGR